MVFIIEFLRKIKYRPSTEVALHLGQKYTKFFPKFACGWSIAAIAEKLQVDSGWQSIVIERDRGNKIVCLIGTGSA